MTLNQNLRVLPMLLFTLLLLDVSSLTSLSVAKAASSSSPVTSASTGLGRIAPTTPGVSSASSTSAGTNAELASLLRSSKKILSICNGGSMNMEGGSSTSLSATVTESPVTVDTDSSPNPGNGTRSYEYIMPVNDTDVSTLNHPQAHTHIASGNSAAEVALEEETMRKEDQYQQQLQQEKQQQQDVVQKATEKKKMKVLFLSADTGGGHRASAESLANQLLKQYPNTEYELVDVWTPTNVYPYKTLVKSYKHLSAHPQQWKALYYISNTKLYEKFTDLHSEWKCYNKIEKQIEELDPDIVISVHPTMTYLPEKAVRRIGEKKGKYIPFFTVVTDFGSGHCTWFQGNVDQLYVASERIANLARKRGKHFDETKMVKSGLPIRDDFAVQAELMGDRTSATGKEYRQLVKTKLNMDPNKKTVLVMGGGEGVGSLAQITEALREQLKSEGVDATICVVCGRNEKLKNELNDRDWETSPKSVGKKSKRMKLRKLISKMSRRRKIGQQAISPAESSVVEGNVDVIGLGFITNMAEYMVAADVLVSKAGPGTIAEAAAVGLPVMMTSFLPGQEAGNVDIVLDGGFGAFKKKPHKIAKVVTEWMQDDEKLNDMSRKSTETGNPTAASEIVQDIVRISMEKINEFES